MRGPVRCSLATPHGAGWPRFVRRTCPASPMHSARFGASVSRLCGQLFLTHLRPTAASSVPPVRCAERALMRTEGMKWGPAWLQHEPGADIWCLDPSYPRRGLSLDDRNARPTHPRCATFVGALSTPSCTFEPQPTAGSSLCCMTTAKTV